MPGILQIDFQRLPLTIRLIWLGLIPKCSAIRRWAPLGPRSTDRLMKSMSCAESFEVHDFSPSCIVPWRRMSIWFSLWVAQRRLETWLRAGLPSLWATSVCAFDGGGPRKATATRRWASFRTGCPFLSRRMYARYPLSVTVPDKSTGASLRPGTASGFRQFRTFLRQLRTSPRAFTSYSAKPSTGRQSSFSIMWDAQFNL